MKGMKRRTFCQGALLLAALTIGLLGCAPSSQNSLVAAEIKNPLQARVLKGKMDSPRAVIDENVPEKKLPPASADELERLGDGYLRNGEYYMAFVQYERSLELNPKNVRVHYKTGLLFLLTNKNKDAENTFRGIIRKKPEYAIAYQGLGQALFQMKNYEEAEMNFRNAVDFDPRLWKARNFLGIIYDFQKKYDLASKEYAEAILLRPDQGLLYNNLGVSLSLAGRYEEAINAFNKALKAKGSKQRAYNNLGLVLAKTGRYEAALDAFREGTDRAKASNNLGCVYLAKGEYKQAEKCFNRAIAVSPNFYQNADDNLKKVRLEAIN